MTDGAVPVVETLEIQPWMVETKVPCPMCQEPIGLKIAGAVYDVTTEGGKIVSEAHGVQVMVSHRHGGHSLYGRMIL